MALSRKSSFHSATIRTILAVAKTEILPRKTLSPAIIFRLESESEPKPPQAKSTIGIVKGKAITAIIGAEFPKAERLPQKVPIKLIAKVAKKIKLKKSLDAAKSRPAKLQIGRVANKIGRAQINQFANILAKIKTSKLSQEVKICSIVPSSKSRFKNSAEEKIKQESNENQIIVTE